ERNTCTGGRAIITAASGASAASPSWASATGGAPTSRTTRTTARQRSWDGPGGAIRNTTSSASSAAQGPWRNCSQLNPSAVAWLASLILSAASSAVAVLGPPPTNQ